jgi:hypothetical protein
MKGRKIKEKEDSAIVMYIQSIADILKLDEMAAQLKISREMVDYVH